eukprot:12930661-Prorocentrum_lima.AAC.1
MTGVLPNISEKRGRVVRDKDPNIVFIKGYPCEKLPEENAWANWKGGAWVERTWNGNKWDPTSQRRSKPWT